MVILFSFNAIKASVMYTPYSFLPFFCQTTTYIDYLMLLRSIAWNERSTCTLTGQSPEKNSEYVSKPLLEMKNKMKT